jgi:hypothetical protein
MGFHLATDNATTETIAFCTVGIYRHGPNCCGNATACDGSIKTDYKKGAVVRTSLTVISTIVSSGQLAGAVGCTSPRCLECSFCLFQFIM